MCYELIPIGGWRAQLTALAQAIKDKASAEGRSNYTPEEENRMNMISDEYEIALTIENLLTKECGC